MDESTQAGIIASVLTNHYDYIKFHPYGTIWGVAFYWDRDACVLQEEPQRNGLSDIVDYLLDDKRIRKPRLILPQHDIHTRKSISCSTNGDLIARRFLEIASYNPALEAIVTEQKLLAEAASQYLGYEERATMDFWEFLVRFDAASQTLSNEGSYRYLFERLYFQFEATDMEQGIMGILSPSIAEQIHIQNEKVYAREHASNEHLQRLASELGVKNRSMEQLRKPRSSISQYLGKIRVTAGRRSGVMDFSAWLDEKKKRTAAQDLIQHEEWVRARVYHLKAKEAWDMVKERPREVLAHYQQLVEQEQNPELRNVYDKIVKELELVSIFDRTPHFHRTITVNIVRGEK